MTASTSDYRQTLLDQLIDVGPLALDMLRGDAAPDPLIVFGALQAAGLLDDTTAERPELRRLRGALMAEIRHTALLPTLAAELDLEPPLWPDPGGDPLAREQVLHQLVALAALQTLLPLPWNRKIENLLESVEADVLLEPEAFVDLAPLARFLSDQLDLSDEHRVMRLLAEVEAAPVALAFQVPEEAAERAMAAAEARIFPSLAEHWAAALARWWRGQPGRAPVLVTASVGLAAAPADDIPELPERTLLYRGQGLEISAVVVGETPLLEWFGDEALAPVQVRLEPSGRVLAQAPALVKGGRCWRLPDEPGDAPPTLVLEGPGGTLEVYLGPKPVS